MKKNWYESKGKWGATLMAVGAFVTALGAFVAGQLDFVGFIQAMTVLGGALGIWGVRDAQG